MKPLNVFRKPPPPPVVGPAKSVAYGSIPMRAPHEWGGGEPKVVLSFGARMPGGATFAQWLRLTIMQRRGYTGKTEVYLDAIALQDKADVNLSIKYTDGQTFSSLDTKFNWFEENPDGTRSSGSVDWRYNFDENEQPHLKQVDLKARRGGVAAMLPGLWEDDYVQAVRAAPTMVFALSKAWFLSEYCHLELVRYIESYRDAAGARAGHHPKRGVVLVFDQDREIGDPTHGMQFLKLAEKYGADTEIKLSFTTLPARRRFTVADPVARATLTGNLAEQWTLTDESTSLLMNFIPPASG